MGNPTKPTAQRRRRWRTPSVRAMLLLVLIIGLPLGLWTRQAQLQRAAVFRIDALNAAVVYDFEILREGRATPEAEYRVFLSMLGAGATVRVPERPAPNARPPEPWKEWTRENLGVDYANAVTQVIAVHSNKIRDADLATLAEFPKLEQLNLGETSIGDAGLAHLVGLRNLKVLHLDTTKVTDAGLAHIEGLDLLETLSLGDNGKAITDAGLARLKSLKNLKVLEIGGPMITDAGLDELQKVASLERLFLIEAPNVTQVGIARLRAALPKLGISRHSNS